MAQAWAAPSRDRCQITSTDLPASFMYKASGDRSISVPPKQGVIVNDSDVLEGGWIVPCRKYAFTYEVGKVDFAFLAIFELDPDAVVAARLDRCWSDHCARVLWLWS